MSNIDARSFQGNMNMDAAPEMLPAGDYTYAMNIQNGVEGALNLLGNRVIDAIASPSSGTDWICGAKYDRVRQRIYYFTFNSLKYHRIVSIELSDLSSTVLFENYTDTGSVDVLLWGDDDVYNPNKIIKDVHIINREFGGDLIYFIDPVKRMLQFNYDTLSTGGYGAVITLEMLKVIKRPPVAPPEVSYSDDATRTVNNLKKKLFQFKYRFVYGDDDKSVWSAISGLPLPRKNDDPDYYADGTKQNVIYVTIATGISTIKKIEIAARVNVGSNWSDFFLVNTINKSLSSISDNDIYTYSFYNDGAYNLIDVEESNLLFDYVPDEANCLEVANGNILVPAGILEGFDKEVDLDVDADISTDQATVITITSSVTRIDLDSFLVSFLGTPSDGDEFTITIVIHNTGTLDVEPVISLTYTANIGDTLTDVLNGLDTLVTSEPHVSSSIVGDTLIVSADTVYDMDSADMYILSATTASSSDSVSTFKWKGRYQFGIAYYTNEGKTRGVYIPKDDSWTIDMPSYSEVSTIPQVPSVLLKITNGVPSNADYFHIVRTKELTAAKSTFVLTGGCGEDADYTYLQIDNLDQHAIDFPSTESVVPYDYTKGDRVRILKRIDSTPTVLDSYDFEIIGVVTDPASLTGDFIKIKKSTLTSGYGFGTSTNRYLIELYTPAQVVSSDLNVYYEIAKRFDIYNDVNGNRSHRGNEQDQIQGSGVQDAEIMVKEGDYYVRERDLTTGTAGIFTYTCMDMNFSDGWLSAVHDEGRPLVVDDDIRKQYFTGLIRHSMPYIQGTNINQLNRFYPDNFEEADVSFGEILRMKTRENFIRVFQRYKVGAMPVYRQIFIDTQGSSNVALSERVLNKINYYAGDYGIDKYGSSLVSTDYGDYFLDTTNRAMCRASLDGITNVSDTFNCAFWFNETLTEDHYGFGAFDYERRIVLMGTATTVDEGDVSNVIGFNEQKKGFCSFYGYHEASCLLFANGKLWSFLVRPYIHDNETRNNFFGAQGVSVITTVFNGAIQAKKTYIAVEELSSDIWICNIQTGDVMNQETDVTEDDFQTIVGAKTYNNKEGKQNAVIRRDQNSVGGKYFGDTMKGNYAIVELTNNKTTYQRLISVTLKYILSQLTNT